MSGLDRELAANPARTGGGNQGSFPDAGDAGGGADVDAGIGDDGDGDGDGDTGGDREGEPHALGHLYFCY